jgi:arabinogalactan endo-1,4-beta-galactosidase
MKEDVAYLDSMTLLGSQRDFRWLPKQASPGSGATAGAVQTGGATSSGKYFLKIADVQGKFKITLKYTDTSSSNTGRYAEIFINGSSKKQGDKTNGTNLVTTEYSYEGTDKVTVQLGCAGGAIRLFDVIIAGSGTTTTTPSTVAVTGVSVSGGGDVTVGSTKTLTATIAPSNATNKTVTWSTSDSGIATVDSSGVVKGVKAGSATITAKTADGGKTASAPVPVKAASSSNTATTKTSDRGGQTIEQLVSAFDSTAKTCSVPAIDNLSSFSSTYLNDYIRGVDISSIIEVENAGGKFYDNDRYRVTDVLEILSYYGINWVRIRLWENPYTSAGKAFGGGTNDYTKAVAIAKRAKKWGMKVMLDIHYSDFWTHPGQQAVPKAWKNDASNVDKLATTLKAYTKKVLSDMYAAGAMPDIVQVGNETVDGFCGWKDSGDKPNEKKLLSAGLAGVREVSKEKNYPIRTMLHATGGMETVKWYYGVMKSLDFDILGLSFYPQYHGNLNSFKTGLQKLADDYKKPICVVEYSVSYTEKWGDPNGDNNYGNSNTDVKTFVNSGQTDRTIQGQASVIRNLNNAIMNNTLSGGTRYGIGAFWWEPAWLPLNGTGWAFAESSEWYKSGLPGSDSGATNSPGNNTKVTWANQAFFSFTGTALPSLNAFLQMMGKAARPAS